MANSSKPMLWTGRVISAIPLLLMCMGIAMFFFKPDQVKDGMGKLGFSSSLALPIIITEICCIVIYLFPPTAVLGAILLTGYLGGAVACHVRAGQPFIMAVACGVLFWLGLFFRDSRVRALIPWRRK